MAWTRGALPPLPSQRCVDHSPRTPGLSSLPRWMQWSTFGAVHKSSSPCSLRLRCYPCKLGGRGVGGGVLLHPSCVPCKPLNCVLREACAACRLWRAGGVFDVLIFACAVVGLSLPALACAMLCRSWRCQACVLHGESSKRPAPPRNTKDRKHLQSSQTTTTHIPSTWHNRKGSCAARESRHTTPISTAAVHAFGTATTCHHYPHPTGASPDPLSQRSPLRSTGGLSRTTHGPVVGGHDKS